MSLTYYLHAVAFAAFAYIKNLKKVKAKTGLNIKYLFIIKSDISIYHYLFVNMIFRSLCLLLLA